ncbi:MULTISPECIES: hypothetical protein [unclassified Corallococcus]|uniref:hypothetical protein n=1 Tax=unclassified Corallococcus TaxID=2685029 RepID=UPI001A8C5088|nr:MULTISPECIES: hypothetical protein [unclassified Corallococcus]MBN9682628.1 hypothetical protein [Corallococcus sp. NCSPR001]WAS85827.1 hypothetical protein O0N60_02370 [Corallococcus sp. NCRR]
MSVAILVSFKAKDRESLYIPVATQGAYHALWLPAAEKLGLKWVPLFEDGPIVDVGELPALMDELRKLRDALAGNPKNDDLLERIDWILEEFSRLDLTEISRISIG